MAEEQVIQAKLRSESGSANSNRLRKRGIVPGVIYGSGEAAVQIQLEEHAFETELRRHVSEHVMLNVSVGGGEGKKVLLKEVQHHPLTDRVLHVDFHEVSLTQKLKVLVPIEIVGEPIGVTRDEGVLEQLLREVEVECLPGDIPERIVADLSALEIGDSISVGELELNDAVGLAADPAIAVAHVSAPRIVEEEATEEGAEGEEGAAEGESAGAEPEVITERSAPESEE